MHSSTIFLTRRAASARIALSALMLASCCATSFAQTREPTSPPKATTQRAAPKVASEANKPPLPSLTPGDRCTGDPKFLEKIGFSKRALVDTTSTHRLGLQVTDMLPDGQRGRSTQHESWMQAGFLGRVQRDKDGNIYTYAAPSVTLVHNPIEKANIIYRVDSATGVMASFAELPKTAPATEQNPFGLLALTLDCEQNALYAASVFGSTASTENGIVAKIDLQTRAVTVVRRGVDALSLLVAFDHRGKRLFAGTARDNVVVSYGINADGTLADDETIEIKLDEVSAAQDKRARVLRIDGRGRMYVRSIPFEYTLAARSTIPTTEMNFVKAASGKGAFSLVDQKQTDVPALRSAPANSEGSPPLIDRLNDSKGGQAPN
jgi:hypothetical protein